MGVVRGSSRTVEAAGSMVQVRGRFCGWLLRFARDGQHGGVE